VIVIQNHTCEKEYDVTHKTRAEQMNVKVRKDRLGLAKSTKRHSPKTAYKRVRIDLQEYRDEVKTSKEFR
jgi:hypothetical protein